MRFSLNIWLAQHFRIRICPGAYDVLSLGVINQMRRCLSSDLAFSFKELLCHPAAGLDQGQRELSPPSMQTQEIPQSSLRLMLHQWFSRLWGSPPRSIWLQFITEYILLPSHSFKNFLLFILRISMQETAQKEKELHTTLFLHFLITYFRPFQCSFKL